MDHTAIKQIQESASLEMASKNLNTANTKTPTLVLPDTFMVEDLEKYMPTRSSYRVNYNTISIEAFVRYCEEQALADTACFVDTEDMTSKVCFDLGTQEKALHRRHNASLTLRKTAPYKALLAFSGRKQGQKDAAEFMEDWENSITIIDDKGNDMKPHDAARAFRNITIERMKSKRSEVGNFAESNDIMDRAEAKAKDLPLPAKITFNTDPYLGFLARDFVMNVSIILDGHNDYTSLGFRIVKKELINEVIGEEFLEILERDFKGRIKTFIGSI